MVETTGLSPLVALLRCLDCSSPLAGEGPLRCEGCGREYPVRAGTVRAVRELPAVDAEVKRRTADSFAYEWREFGAPRAEWRRNFLDYMQPHPPEFFAGKRVLDVGTGSGRHAREAAALGAQVVAADLGDSIDVARANLPPQVLTVQADAEHLPLEPGSFDLVCSVGVLHHLPEPERAFRSIVPYAKAGGWVQVYLYWEGEQPWHRAVLRAVRVARRITTRLPHRLLHALCYPLAGLLWAVVVLPYKLTRGRARLGRIAERLPLKTYAEYPFGVLVNDQFDRLSAPIENRYSKDDVRRWLEDAGLEQVSVIPNGGWVASGRAPGGS